MGNGEKAFFSRGEVIFREGDPPTGMFILLDGCVELKKRGEKGETLLRTVSAANEFFGEMALIDGKPRSATAIATCLSTLLIIDGNTFEKLVASNGAFAAKVIKVLSERIRTTNVQLQEIVDTDLHTRIALGIMDFALRFGKASPGDARAFFLPEMRDWVNSHIGVSREEVDSCVSRMIRTEELAEADQRGAEGGLILSGAFIRANDRRHEYDRREA